MCIRDRIRDAPVDCAARAGDFFGEQIQIVWQPESGAHGSLDGFHGPATDEGEHRGFEQWAEGFVTFRCAVGQATPDDAEERAETIQPAGTGVVDPVRLEQVLDGRVAVPQFGCQRVENLLEQ